MDNVVDTHDAFFQKGKWAFCRYPATTICYARKLPKNIGFFKRPPRTYRVRRNVTRKGWHMQKLILIVCDDQEAVRRGRCAHVSQGQSSVNPRSKRNGQPFIITY